jgi:hypothetical protein
MIQVIQYEPYRLIKPDYVAFAADLSILTVGTIEIWTFTIPQLGRMLWMTWWTSQDVLLRMYLYRCCCALIMVVKCNWECINNCMSLEHSAGTIQGFFFARLDISIK